MLALIGVALIVLGAMFIHVSFRYARVTSKTARNDTSVGRIFSIGFLMVVAGVVTIIVGA